MPKKIDETEVKKECPSCGLGVSLDSRICEFCGWDFEEEDEWILQIEKLERDLMLEKQKFEPGTVEDKIESTLHTPALERREGTGAPPKLVVEEHVKEPEIAPTRAVAPKKSVPAPKPVSVSAPKVPEPKPVVVGSTPATPIPPPEPPKTRRVRSVKVSSIQAPAERARTASGEVTMTKTRLVRKVKHKS